MKLITLNTWGGRAGLEQLLTFFKSHSDTDIFCLQEVWNGGEHMLDTVAGGSKLTDSTPQLLSAIARALPGHNYYFKPHFYDFYGLAIFIKKDIAVVEEGDLFVYKERGYISKEEAGNHARNLQYVTFETSAGPRTVLNMHGLWKGGAGKLDIEERLEQSDNVAAFLKTLQNPSVLVGDFNLLPDTESLRRIEAVGMRNLIKEHGVTSTRTSHYKKPDKFADYVLVNDGVEVTDFKVLPEEVSDHAALYVEFT